MRYEDFSKRNELKKDTMQVLDKIKELEERIKADTESEVGK